MNTQQKAVAEEFDEYQSTYKDTVNAALSFSGLKVDFFTKVKTEYMLDILQRAFGEPKNLSVLDVGCGVGNYHELLSGQFASLDGVDVSSACIEVATGKNPNVKYQTYSGERLPYNENRFDVVFTICVVHHVPQDMWNNFVKEMARVLKPGGMAIVFEHNPRNPLTMRVVNRCPFDKDAVLLNSSKLMSLFRLQAFANVQARHILTIPPINRFLRRVDSVFAKLPLGAQYYLTARKPGQWR